MRTTPAVERMRAEIHRHVGIDTTEAFRNLKLGDERTVGHASFATSGSSPGGTRWSMSATAFPSEGVGAWVEVDLTTRAAMEPGDAIACGYALVALGHIAGGGLKPRMEDLLADLRRAVSDQMPGGTMSVSKVQRILDEYSGAEG